MDQFPAFVLVSCLRMMDQAEEDQARAARLFDLRLRAGLIQVHQAGVSTSRSETHELDASSLSCITSRKTAIHLSLRSLCEASAT